MNQETDTKIESKIHEDLSPTRNLTGLHLKIVVAIAIIWSLFQLWYASPFPFIFNIGMFKGLPARAIHLGFALLLAFLIFPISRNKKISKIITFTGHDKNNPLSKLGDINFWINSKAYNFVENTHQIWLLAICDLIIGKREYLPN